MCEILNFTPVNPLISKCQIKVCYVGDEPNRNGSIITKAVATEMAKSLPGCPIVGFYNETKEDFEEHNRVIDISNGKFEVKDMTRPYGFVDLNAKVWFQKFMDDGIEHEYLITEGYLWTKVYPESKRIIAHGNNQSMELDNETMKGSWTTDDNDFPEFFIINEALISKLCILGEDVEPCFEGASIKGDFSFSLDNEFKQQVFSMMQELKEVLNKGGITNMNEDQKDPVVTEDQDAFKKNQDEKEQDDKKKTKKDTEGEKEKTPPADEEDPMDDDPEEDDPEDKKKKKDSACGGGTTKKKKKYSYDELSEIPEYVELSKKYLAMEKEFNSLKEEVTPLRAFKAQSEKKAKEDMIQSFYMLSDEDKKDCSDNIDKYSLNDIEAKLSIVCVRNKVNFNLDDDKPNKDLANPTVYSLGDNDDGDAAPAWIKAVRSTANKQN